jgi:GAF domain-containing protein
MADRIRRREERLAAEARIGAALATTLDPPAIAAAALAELAAHVGAAIGAVYVLEGEALVRAAGHGGPDVLPREGIVAEALARGRPVRLGAIPKDLPFAMAAGFGQVWPRSVLAVPLAARGERVGLLLLGSLADLDDDAHSLAERAGGELGIALQSALAHRRLNALVADLRSHARREAQGDSLRGHAEAIHAQASDHRDELDEVVRGQGARRTDGRTDRAAPTLAPSPEGPERRAPVAYRSR